jgi:hypothetical protein
MALLLAAPTSSWVQVKGRNYVRDESSACARSKAVHAQPESPRVSPVLVWARVNTNRAPARSVPIVILAMAVELTDNLTTERWNKRCVLRATAEEMKFRHQNRESTR